MTAHTKSGGSKIIRPHWNLFIYILMSRNTPKIGYSIKKRTNSRGGDCVTLTLGCLSCELRWRIPSPEAAAWRWSWPDQTGLLQQPWTLSPRCNTNQKLQIWKPKFTRCPRRRQALGRYLGVKLIWMVLASLDPRNPKPGATLNTPGSSNSGHNYTKKNPTKIV